jgi:protein-S-isoprenylcysteine O-methyltransferase Ste14
MNKNGQKLNFSKHKNKHHKVHNFLAYSYFVYLFVLILGVLLDMLLPVKVFHESIMFSAGIVLIIFSSILIVWAQKSSVDLLEKENVSKEHFCRGPYCYTRTPTHYGLFFAVVGFGFIINSFFVILLTVASFLFTKITFVKKQELELEKKFGEAYREYKKIVKF